MSFIHENVAALFIAFVVCGFGWMYGGRDPEVVLRYMPWLTLFMLEVALCFPQRHVGETTSHARSRVWGAMKRDPLVWTALGFVALLCIPFLNTGLCPLCDRALIALGHDARPPFGFLPFCVDRVRHLHVFMWFVPTLAAMVAARHCLTRYGKRTLLEMVVWNGLALAVLGFVQQVCDAPGPLWRPFASKSHVYFFSTFGYPNMAGCYFTTLFCLSAALWRWHADEVHEGLEKTNEARRFAKHRIFWLKHYMFIPTVVCLLAAFTTLSRAAIIFACSTTTVLFVHAVVSAIAKKKKADRVRAMAFCGLALVMLAVAASAFMPEDVAREMRTVDTRGALDRVTGRSEYHSRIATEIWKEHLAFGTGGWGYLHFASLRLPKGTYMGAGSANVHNDHLQFLVEHGLIGYLCLVAMVSMLLTPLAETWIRLSKATRFLPTRKQPPPPRALFALPGAAFSMLVAALVPVLHAFGDCPFRAPAVLSLFFVSLACVGGFLPREEREHEPDGGTRHSK